MARLALGLVGAYVGSFIGQPGLGFALGSAIGGAIEGRKTQRVTIPGPRLGDAQAQTSREGVPIPIGWGLFHVSGNIIQIGPLNEVTTTTTTTESGGGGKGGGGGKVETTTSETRRHRTFAIGVARSSIGPILGITRIWEYDKLVYDVRAVPAIPVADTNDFAAGIRIHLGTETQVADPELEAITGVGGTPAYRGLAYVTFVEKDITDFGSVIPQYRFEVEAGAAAFRTSRPYPVEIDDDLGMTGRVGRGRIYNGHVEEMSLGGSLTAGELKTLVITYDDALPEEMDVSAALTAGVLDTIVITYDDALPEEMDVTAAVTAGVLDTVVIDYSDALPEEIDVTATLTAGVLS